MADIPSRLLFLDIDGVLNSQRWVESGAMRSHSKMEQHFDPAACRLLNDVIRRTSCGLVLSSSWRIMTATGWIERVIRERGCPLATFYGETPNLHGVGSDDDRRGREISAWIHNAKWTGSHVIVDDSNDMGFEQRKYLVRTSWQEGMTEKTVDDIESMFERWERAR